MATPKDAGLDFLKRISAHIPADKREALLADLQTNEALLTALGEDRDALDQDRARLTDWYQTNSGALKRADQVLKAHAAGRLDDLEDTDPALRADPDDPLGVRRPQRRIPEAAPLTEATIQARIQAAVANSAATVSEQGLALINKMTTIGLTHFKDFNEVLNSDELTQYAIKNNLRLDLAYDAYIKPKRDAVALAASTKALEEAEARGKAAGLAEAINRQVPVPPGSIAGSTLSGLTTTGKPDASMPALVQALREAGVNAA